MRNVLRLVMVVSALAGCYSPNLERCTVRCSGDEPCPDNMACTGDGFCHTSDDSSSCGGGGGGGGDGGGGDTTGGTVTLSVAVVGDGQGEVTADRLGIDCGNGNQDCLAQVTPGTDVTLTAASSSSSLFFGWSANCTGDPCVVEIDDQTTVTAEFDLATAVTIEFFNNGDGSVTSNPLGIGTCDDITGSGECAGLFPSNKSLSLTATPANDGSVFGGWDPDGPCNGQGETCTFVPGPDEVDLGVAFN
jgi:hypothetical protein|nr:hypothetical protein [Kofleriaceae bacterium]